MLEKAVQDIIDLIEGKYKGKNGVDGKDGAAGTDAKNIEWRIADKSLQWRYEGSFWNVILHLENLQGKDGSAGKDGRGGIDGVKGDTGKDGSPGRDGAAGKNGVNGKDGKDAQLVELRIYDDYIQWRSDGDWQNLILLDKLRGKNGAQGPRGTPGVNGANGSQGPQGPQGEPGDPADAWLMPPIIDWYDPEDGLPGDGHDPLEDPPEVGDRYGADGDGSGWYDGYIYEWDGEGWIESEPDEGWMLWCLFELLFYVFFSGGWMEVGDDTFLRLDCENSPLYGDLAIYDSSLTITDEEDNPLLTLRADGSIQPVQLADNLAVNDSIYYSTDAGKLVYKDALGAVNALY